MSASASSHRALLEEKLAFLREEEALAIDSAAKSNLRKQIEDAERQLGDLPSHDARGGWSVPPRLTVRQPEDIKRWIRFTGTACAGVKR